MPAAPAADWKDGNLPGCLAVGLLPPIGKSTRLNPDSAARSGYFSWNQPCAVATALRLFLTIEEALDLQVSDAQAEHGELVQAGPDLLGEGQQAGELVQLPVEPVSVAFGRVGLDAIGRRRFGAGGAERASQKTDREQRSAQRSKAFGR